MEHPRKPWVPPDFEQIEVSSESSFECGEGKCSSRIDFSAVHQAHN